MLDNHQYYIYGSMVVRLLPTTKQIRSLPEKGYEILTAKMKL